MASIRTEAAPISWLHVFGLLVILWAVSSDSIAQARDLVVTEVRGTAVRSNSSPVRSLDTLKVGERIRLSSDSRVCLFADQDAGLYEIDGPAEIQLSPKGVLANGKAVEARKLADAYRNVKVNGSELVQGSMVMRNTVGVRIVGPEGVVAEDVARRFSWTAGSGSLRLELSTQAGEVIYRTNVRGESFVLPPEVSLVAGERYVWGILPANGSSTPLDWTEFSVAPVGVASAPGARATSTEKVLYAAWLKAQGMERAAFRSLAFARN